MRINQILQILGVLLLSACVFSASQFVVFISKSQIQEEADLDFKEAVKQVDVASLKTMLKAIDVTVESKKVTLTPKTLTVSYKSQEDQTTYITAAVTRDADKQVTITKKAAAGALKVKIEFTGKIGEEAEKDYSTVLLTTDKLAVTQKYTKPGAAFTEDIQVELTDNLVGSQNVCPDDFKTTCDQVMTKVSSEYSSLINASLKGGIKKGIRQNEPFSKKAISSELATNIPNSNKAIVFDLSEVTNPEYNEVEGTDGLYRFYSGNSKLSTDKDFAELKSTQSIFNNFLTVEGDYQYAFSQSAVNKAYSLLIDDTENKNISIVGRTFENLIEAFPDLAQSYARDDEFTVDLKTDSFDAEKSMFKGKLTLRLPSVGSQSAIDIAINYDYYLDNITMKGYNNEEKTLQISLMNVFSYVGEISVAGDCGIIYENRLRNWLTSALQQIHNGEVMKNAFQNGTKYTALVPELYKESSYQNGSYIFVTKASSVSNNTTPSLVYKNTKFLEENN